MFLPIRCNPARNRRLPMALLAAAGTLALSAAAWAQAPAPAAPVDPAKVVATVDGLPVTERDLQFAVEDMGGSMPQLSPEQRRDYLVNFMTDLKLAAKAAGEKKIDELPDFKTRLGYYRDKVLVDEYLAQEAQEGRL